jgi:hypothetical protein
MNDNFCVTASVKMMALPLQFGAKLKKVIDFTIKNNPNTTVFIVDRLMTARYIDYAEPSYT